LSVNKIPKSNDPSMSDPVMTSRDATK